MKKPFRILLFLSLLVSLTISAQKPYTSLYYSYRLLNQAYSFQPVLSAEAPQNNLLGLKGSLIGSYTYGLGESCECGSKLKIPLYTFLKEPLIRKYGENWYKELLESAKLLS